MIHDYYATLSERKSCPEKKDNHGLGSGFVDGCTVWSCADKKQGEKEDPKNTARQCYVKRAAGLSGNIKLPPELAFEPDFGKLPDPSWLGIEVMFTLETPWYSKDDRPFHVLDNPVRKDRVFGVPFMSASSWKGMLRWAYGMQSGLFGPTQEKDEEKKKKATKEIVHLFGNEKGEVDKFQSGALVFYPTWFNKVGFEVINPHSRKTKAGTQPIYYEVVPVGTSGILNLLYAPMSGQSNSEAIEKLLHAVQLLLETYGISAKRTVGWGTARIDNKEEFIMKIQEWRTGKGASHE
jgi:CRISPR-associated protein Cmr2